MLKPEAGDDTIVQPDERYRQLCQCAADIDGRHPGRENRVRSSAVVDPGQDAIAAPILQPRRWRFVQAVGLKIDRPRAVLLVDLATPRSSPRPYSRDVSISRAMCGKLAMTQTAGCVKSVPNSDLSDCPLIIVGSNE